MIKYECDHGKINLEATGTGAEICADICTLIHSVHTYMCSKNLFEGLAFEAMFRENVDTIFEPMEDDADFIKYNKKYKADIEQLLSEIPMEESMDEK